MTTDNLPPLTSIRELPRQFAWCEQDNKVFEADDLSTLREVARICGTVSVRCDGDRLTKPHMAVAVNIAAGLRVPLVLVWSPWGFKLPREARADGHIPGEPNPAEAGESRITEVNKHHLRWAMLAKRWITEANTAFSSSVKVGWHAVDFERWRYPSEYEAFPRIREFYTLLTNMFGTDGSAQEWYARGQWKMSGRGWIKDSYGSEFLDGIKSVGCCLYQIARPEYDQARFSQTLMNNQYASSITPWVALDSGWAPRLGWWPEDKPSWFGVSESWKFGDQYPVPDWCAWLAGLWMCSGSAGPPEYPDNRLVRRGVFYPGAMDSRCPNWLRQFKLFAMGSRAVPTIEKPEVKAT